MSPSSSIRIVALALAVVVAAPAAGCRTPRDDQRSEARHWPPSKAATDAELARKLQPRTIRVYADPSYRAETQKWRDSVRLQVAAASELFEGWFGVRLVIDELREWEREGSVSMEQLVDELARTDPGDDVTWVLGLTGSAPSTSEDVHYFGMAHMTGKHLVMRAINDHAELDYLKKHFDKLTNEELDDLYAQRKAHKEAVVLLHEIGHTLGAIHTRDDGLLMSENYSATASTLAPSNREILTRALALQFAHPDHEAWQQAMIEYLVARFRQGGIDDLQPRAVERHRKSFEEGDGQGYIGALDTNKLNDAIELYNSRKFAEAARLLEELLGKHPDNRKVLTVACRAGNRLSKGQPDKELERRCFEAAKLEPDDAEATLDLADHYVTTGDRERAHEVVSRAVATLERVSDPRRRVWTYAAELYAAAGALSDAEALLDKADSDSAKRIGEEIRRQRRFFGIPVGAADGKVELELVARLEALAGLEPNDRNGRATLVRDLVQDFPDAAATHAALCQLNYNERELEPALRECRLALDKDPECSLAHFYLGLALVTSRDLSGAETHLDRAIALSPEVQAYWVTAQKIYKGLKDRRPYDRTADAYRKRYGKDLKVE